MHKSTLLELLRTFTKDELDKFDLFLRSPYYNKTSNAVKFFSLIRKHAPEFESDDLEKEKVWKKMFPDKKYNYGTMKNLIYLLTKLALKFVTLEYSETKQMAHNSDMISTLMKRGTENLLSQKFNEFDKLYTEGVLKDKGARNSIQFYYELSNIYSNKNLFALTSKLSTPDENITLQESVYSVCSILIKMTKSFNNLLASSYGGNKQMTKSPVTLMMKEMHSGVIEKIMPLIKEISEREAKILGLYMNVSKAQLNPGNIDYYKVFVEDFNESLEMLPGIDGKTVLTYRSVLLSFLDDEKINTANEAMDVCRLMIKNKFFESENGQLQAFTYYHYLLSAFIIKDFEEINIFSKKYLKKISGDLFENAESFTNALISFGDKRFEECLGHLSKLNYNFFLMKVEIKLIKAKCLYEMNDYLLFENEYKSLYHFLKNNKTLSQEVHDGLKKEFEMINKLFRLREKYDEHEHHLLKKEILRSESLKNSWYFDQLKIKD